MQFTEGDQGVSCKAFEQTGDGRHRFEAGRDGIMRTSFDRDDDILLFWRITQFDSVLRPWSN